MRVSRRRDTKSRFYRGARTIRAVIRVRRGLPAARRTLSVRFHRRQVPPNPSSSTSGRAFGLIANHTTSTWITDARILITATEKSPRGVPRGKEKKEYPGGSKSGPARFPEITKPSCAFGVVTGNLHYSSSAPHEAGPLFVRRGSSLGDRERVPVARLVDPHPAAHGRHLLPAGEVAVRRRFATRPRVGSTARTGTPSPRFRSRIADFSPRLLRRKIRRCDRPRAPDDKERGSKDLT